MRARIPSRASMSRVRVSRVGIALLCAVLLLAGCSGPAPSGRTGDGVELEFWTWVPGIEKAVAMWNARHPDVQVKVNVIPAGERGGYAKIQSALKSGTAPDLAQIEYMHIPSFLLEGGLLDLRRYGAQRYRGLFSDWQWKQGAVAGGIYAIPQAAGPLAMYYRKDLFAKWGIPAPRTWAEYERAAATIRQRAPGTYITTFPPVNGWWFSGLAWQAGAKWVRTKGNTWLLNINDAATRKVARYWDRLRQRDLIATKQDQQSGWYADIQNGRIVTWIAAQWSDVILQGNAPNTKGKWAVAPMPQWRPGEHAAANWGGSSTAILRGSEHPREALRFSIWLNTNPDAIRSLFETGYGWPAAKGAVRRLNLTKPDPFYDGQNLGPVFEKAANSVDTSWKWHPTIQATITHLQDSFGAAVAGHGDFVSALDDAQRRSIDDMEAKDLQVRGGR